MSYEKDRVLESIPDHGYTPERFRSFQFLSSRLFFFKNPVTDIKCRENGNKIEHNFAGATLALPKRECNIFSPSSGQNPNVISTIFVLFCGETIFLVHIQPGVIPR